MKSTKICNTCQTEKDIFEYQRCSANADGVNNKCRACVKTYRKEQRLKNYERNLIAGKRLAMVENGIIAYIRLQKHPHDKPATAHAKDNYAPKMASAYQKFKNQEKHK